jgi:hypothetical protein
MCENELQRLRDPLFEAFSVQRLLWLYPQL